MAEKLNISGNSNNPESLYAHCLRCIVANTNYSVPSLERVHQLRYLPQSLLIDAYELLSRRECLKDALLEQLSELEVFLRLLRFSPARSKLHRILGDLVNSKKMLAGNLRRNYVQRFELQKEAKSQRTASKLSKLAKAKIQQQKHLAQAPDPKADAMLSRSFMKTEFFLPKKTSGPASVGNTDTDIDADADADSDTDADAADLIAADADTGHYDIDPVDCGLRLGTFLAEAGWMSDSMAVLQCLNARLKIMNPDMDTMLLRIDCLQRLLQAQSAHCDFKAAKQTVDEIHELRELVFIPGPLKAITYTQISAMYFARNEYDNSHKWSVLAMRELQLRTPVRIAIDVLRQAAKACVVKRDFSRANMLICQAVHRAREAFGNRHQKYGDTLLDYGFFLLNVDSIDQSVRIYKEALDVRRQIFGNRNFHVAIAHEDLSYAYYVHEYSTGDFSCAQDHVDKAVDIMKELVPSNHLMLASAKRVRALLLEEIALDKIAVGRNEEGLLNQSEELHKLALQLSLEVFGEVNVQTAKHYGNLGRLYQTMNRFEEAESMHQKAIKIKTDLLGAYDYEVGLSIGHLASLYNYQMEKYREAEDLYLRSIDISLRLFGRSYSGLEYDYLGLCHIYEKIHNFEKYLQYANVLEHWQVLRGQNLTQNKLSYPPTIDKCTLEEVKYKFFNMISKNALDERHK